MIPGQLSFTSRLIALFASLAGFLVFAPAFAHGGACERWPENRLILGDLEGRRFDLEAVGPIEEVPRFDAAESRIVLHRAFRLFLDIAEPIALFKSSSPRTLIIARDREMRLPLMVPVFFVGRRLQSLDGLFSDASLAAFDSSRRLHDGDEFSAVQFHLRNAGSRFSDIRPFFACGLAGVLLCEGACPGDSALLAASLVHWKLDTSTAAPDPAKTGQSGAAPLRNRCAKTGLPHAPRGADCGELDAGSRAKSGAPIQPKTENAPPGKEQSAGVDLSPLPRLLLSFQTPSGGVIPAADVLAAEGRIGVEGVVLNLSEGGLGARLTADVIRQTKSIEGLGRLFPHFKVESYREEGPRTIVVMEPLFVRAADLRIEIVNGGGKPVSGCELSLFIGDDRGAGRAWKGDAAGTAKSLKFRESGQGYVAALPEGVAPNELLISTSQPGRAGRLVNGSDGCELEANPYVTAEELASGVIRRALRAAGPLLIALFSTDAEIFRAADPEAVKDFWLGALDLAGSVSAGRWDRSLLARAQAFGPMPETRILDQARAGMRLGEEVKASVLQVLIEGSREQAFPRAILNRKPIERFHLDLALEPLREDAGIDPATTMKQESLLLVTGGGGLQESFFCREPLHGEESPWITPVWLSQARRIFAIEIWSDPETEELLRKQRAVAMQGAPAGVYRCQTASLHDPNVELYGLAPAALASSVRAAAFAYLTVQANTFLKP